MKQHLKRLAGDLAQSVGSIVTGAFVLGIIICSIIGLLSISLGEKPRAVIDMIVRFLSTELLW